MSRDFKHYDREDLIIEVNKQEKNNDESTTGCVFWFLVAAILAGFLLL